MDTVADVVDLEEYAKAGKNPPKAKSYKIRIDKAQYTVHSTIITGKELLELAGKAIDRFKVYQQLRGGGQPQPIALDEKVDLTTPGIEKFKTLPVDSTDGLAEPRRQFRLPEADEQFLDSLGLRWEAIIDGAAKWIVVYDYQLPEGYNVPAVDLAVRISPDYPTAQLDMAYFAPALSRKDGRAIGAVSGCSIAERAFQQWSRHRTASSAWRAGEDDLQSHFLYIRSFLQRELAR
jgi:hypothetical protein